MERRESSDSSRNYLASRHRKSSSAKDFQRLRQEMVGDPWPVTKFGYKEDSVLEAAQVLLQARNSELVNECGNAITLLPASGAIPGIQGGSREKALYSLRSPKIEPFKVHLWQTPTTATWNRTMSSWNHTPGRIMVRRGSKSEPLTHLLKTLGVTKCEAKESDLCKHFQCWRFHHTRVGWFNEYPRRLREIVNQRWWSFNGFRFLELPPELREIILTFALGLVVVPFMTWWHAKRYPKLVTPKMSLSLVNKQLNCEVTATLLAHTTFYFHTIEQFKKFFPHTDEKSRFTYRPVQGLRSVELELSPWDLLRLFGVSFCFGARDTSYRPISTLDLSTLFNGESPLCYRIRIKIKHVSENSPLPSKLVAKRCIL